MTEHNNLTASIHSACDWTAVADHWQIAEGCTYLNHGSFGPSPTCVQRRRTELLTQLEAQPMDFLIRQLPDLIHDSLTVLAKFLGADVGNLAFISNATAAMNVVASNLELQPGDEVLLTDHEYGAVVRIWGQACKQVGAKTVLARLPLPLTEVEAVVESIFAAVTERTRVLVVSHVTSPTAVILPIREICRRARERGIITVVDGPHAPLQVPVNLREIDPDFYCASCHKWLCGPFGSGFLYVRSRYKQGLQPNIISWGRSLKGEAPHWTDEFHWPGTYDPTPYLALPEAIRFFEEVGIARFRQQTHLLAQYARRRLLELTDRQPLTADDAAWYGSMVTVPLEVPGAPQIKPGERLPLQNWLAQEHGFEIPAVEWHGNWHIRVSCHLYNTPQQIDALIDLLREAMH